MAIGMFCHTAQADSLFDGPLSRSFDRRSHLEDGFWDSLEVVDGRPAVAVDQPRFDRVAKKIIHGLYYSETESLLHAGEQIALCFSETYASAALPTLTDIAYETTFAPDFKYRHNDTYWQLVFFESFQCIAMLQKSARS